MRNITATLCLVLIAFIGYAQTDNSGINTPTPNACLDIQAVSPNTKEDLSAKANCMALGRFCHNLSKALKERLRKELT